MGNISRKQLILIVVFVIVVLAAAGGAYYGYRVGYGKGMEIGKAATQVEAGEAVSNPMEKMPSTNPFEEVVNPFEEGYKNPFE